MQITSNTTSMEAGLCVATDKQGRDFCVTVVKGTFFIDDNKTAVLAEEQEPLIYADVHYGDPANTSIKYECDFARFKPRADVIVNGYAYSPTGRPVGEVVVALEFGSLKKVIRVIGDRRWEEGALGVRRSLPAPFVTMPLVFDRSFGGSDHTHEKLKYQGAEVRNPVGVGFHINSDPKYLVGKSLPNLEDPRYPYREWSDTPPPIGFGVIGRNWQPRITHAGTYDDRWLAEQFPFLPENFNDSYFQSAPEDQQVPFLRGGEVVRCINMTPREHFVAEVPRVDIPITFRFWNREEKVQPNLDTLIVEPDQSRIILAWRACVPLGRKLHSLREVLVGPRLPSIPMSLKPHFKSIPEFIKWKRRKGLQ